MMTASAKRAVHDHCVQLAACMQGSCMLSSQFGQPMPMSGLVDMPCCKCRASTSGRTCAACAPTCHPRRSTSSQSITMMTGSQGAAAPTPSPCSRPSSVQLMLRWGCALPLRPAVKYIKGMKPWPLVLPSGPFTGWT